MEFDSDDGVHAFSGNAKLATVFPSLLDYVHWIYFVPGFTLRDINISPDFAWLP